MLTNAYLYLSAEARKDFESFAEGYMTEAEVLDAVRDVNVLATKRAERDAFGDVVLGDSGRIVVPVGSCDYTFTGEDFEMHASDDTLFLV